MMELTVGSGILTRSRTGSWR